MFLCFVAVLCVFEVRLFACRCVVREFVPEVRVCVFLCLACLCLWRVCEERVCWGFVWCEC